MSNTRALLLLVSNGYDGPMDITQELVREMFDYDEGDAAKPLVRKKGGPGCKIGDRVGRADKEGYYFFKMKNREHRVHRIVFLWHNGYVPDMLDHKDRDRSVNLIGNIRECTASQNCMNRENHGGKSKYKGVHYATDRGKWRAMIKKDGIRTRIGSYATEEEAAHAYDAKAKELHGEFASLNFGDDT